MRTRLLGWVVLLLGAAGCALVGRPTVTVSPLEGSVDFGPGRQTLATMSEIASASTVSLIDSVDGQTKATSVTTGSGAFVLSFGSSFAPADRPYYLEAIKGLAVGGSPNRAGASAARIRTLVLYNNGWTSITNASAAGSLIVSRTTTALSILSGLKSLTDAQNRALIGSLTLGQADSTLSPTTPDTFSPGSTGISNAEFHRAFELSDNAVTLDQDPMQVISIDSLSGQLVRRDPGFNVTRLNPASAARSSTIQVIGSHFPPSPTSIGVIFGNTMVTPSTVSADGTTLTVTVPDLGASALSTTVSVRVGGLEHAGFAFSYSP